MEPGQTSYAAPVTVKLSVPKRSVTGSCIAFSISCTPNADCRGLEPNLSIIQSSGINAVCLWICLSLGFFSKKLHLRQTKQCWMLVWIPVSVFWKHSDLLRPCCRFCCVTILSEICRQAFLCSFLSFRHLVRHIVTMQIKLEWWQLRHGNAVRHLSLCRARRIWDLPPELRTSHTNQSLLFLICKSTKSLKPHRHVKHLSPLVYTGSSSVHLRCVVLGVCLKTIR